MVFSAQMEILCISLLLNFMFVYLLVILIFIYFCFRYIFANFFNIFLFSFSFLFSFIVIVIRQRYSRKSFSPLIVERSPHRKMSFLFCSNCKKESRENDFVSTVQ